jgi:hypothetical protein
MPRLQILNPCGEHAPEALALLSLELPLTTNVRRFAPTYPGVATSVGNRWRPSP